MKTPAVIRVQRHIFLTNYTSVDGSAFAGMAIAPISIFYGTQAFPIFFRVLIFGVAFTKEGWLATQSIPLGSAPAQIKFRSVLRLYDLRKL